MSPEVDRDPTGREARVRVALAELARGATVVPTRSLDDDALRVSPSDDDRRVRLLAVAAAAVLIVGAGALLVRRSNSDRTGVSSTATAPADGSDDSFAPTDTEVGVQPSPGLATGWFAGLGPDTYASLPAAPIDGRIGDPAVVTELVQQLANAPVDLSPRPESGMDGRRYMIESVRNDGTSTVQAYWIGTGQLGPGIDLPPTWATAVEAALAAADTG